MSIATEISALTNDRNAIRAALVDKGVSAGDHGFDDFAEDISGISVGSAPLMLYAGNNKFATESGGWTTTGGNLTESMAYFDFYSGSGGAVKFLHTANPIDLSAYSTLVFVGNKNNSSGTTLTFGVATSPAVANIIKEVDQRYSTTKMFFEELDLTTITDRSALYVFVKNGGTSAYRSYLATCFAY